MRFAAFKISCPYHIHKSVHINRKGFYEGGTMRTDWMPGTRSGQLALAKRWLGILPDKTAAWRIPE
jgi:hypothetical protein